MSGPGGWLWVILGLCGGGELALAIIHGNVL
jgi:hypothetical protein